MYIVASVHTFGMQLLRLSGRKVCDKVIDKGFVWKGKTMIVRWLPGAPPRMPKDRFALYFGTLASTHLHKSAVKRNRMRRRCKEAFRLAVKNADAKNTGQKQSYQLLVSPRSASLMCAFGDIETDVSRFLSQLR